MTIVTARRRARRVAGQALRDLAADMADKLYPQLLRRLAPGLLPNRVPTSPPCSLRPNPSKDRLPYRKLALLLYRPAQLAFSGLWTFLQQFTANRWS